MFVGVGRRVSVWVLLDRSGCSRVARSVPRRIAWWALRHDRSGLRSFLDEAKLPLPNGLAAATGAPVVWAAARYNGDLKDYVLPYEAVRTAASPEAALTEFLESTYNAAADLARWNRADLERR